MELGQYACEVIASYAATALLLGGLVALTLLRSKRVNRALEEAEARVKRNG